MTPRCLRPASGHNLLHRPSQSWTRLATGRLHAVRETVLDVRLRARTRPRLHLDGMRGVDGCCLVTARRSSARRWLFFPPVRSRESLAVPFLSLLLPLRPSLTTSPMARTYTICVPRPERPSSHRLHQEVARAPQSQPAPNKTHPLSPEAVAPGSPSHQQPHCPLRLHPPPPKPSPPYLLSLLQSPHPTTLNHSAAIPIFPFLFITA